MRTTIDISGMGGRYENHCQLMLQEGLRYLELVPVQPKDFKMFGGANTKAAKELDLAMMAVVGPKPTVSQYNMVSWWLFFIHQNGWAHAIEYVKDHDPERLIYDWDGTSRTCPPVNPQVINGLKLLGVELSAIYEELH